MYKGLKFIDSVIVYNGYEDGLMETVYFVGTRFDNVRVELTQASNIKESGNENSDSCLIKILNNENLSKPYLPAQLWKKLPNEEKLNYFTLDEKGKDFFVIVKKKNINIDYELPVGLVENDDYKGGFYQYVRDNFGFAYAIHSLNIPDMIPRFEVSGA